MYYAILGMFGIQMVENFKLYGVLKKSDVEEIWNLSMEERQVQFGELTEEAKKMLGME